MLHRQVSEVRVCGGTRCVALQRWVDTHWVYHCPTPTCPDPGRGWVSEGRRSVCTFLVSGRSDKRV